MNTELILLIMNLAGFIIISMMGNKFAMNKNKQLKSIEYFAFYPLISLIIVYSFIMLRNESDIKVFDMLLGTLLIQALAILIFVVRLLEIIPEKFYNKKMWILAFPLVLVVLYIIQYVFA